VNTCAGFRSVTDVLVGWDQANEKETASTQEHFVRASAPARRQVRLPCAGSELVTITGGSDSATVATAPQPEL
jgi:hypothetical protein